MYTAIPPPPTPIDTTTATPGQVSSQAPTTVTTAAPPTVIVTLPTSTILISFLFKFLLIINLQLILLCVRSVSNLEVSSGVTLAISMSTVGTTSSLNRNVLKDYFSQIKATVIFLVMLTVKIWRFQQVIMFRSFVGVFNFK